jgi:PKD repeat protein
MRNCLIIVLLCLSKFLHSQTCIPTSDNGTILGDYIYAVSLGTFEQISGPSNAPYYADYTSTQAPDLAINAFYTLQLSSGSSETDEYAVWIDWNNDGDFFDQSELIGQQTSYVPGEFLDFPFQVPTGIAIGTKRMRVRCAFAGINMSPCGNYIYGETEDYTINVTPQTPSGYCTPIYAGGSLQNDYIKSVVLLNMSNVSGPSADPFYDYFTSAAVPELTPGITYVVNVQNGYSNFNRFAAWIDWNDDDDFQDVDEKLGEEGASANYEQVQITFTVPLNASAGNRRLRVRSAFNTIGINPCQAYSFGETEDYDVNVVQSPTSTYCIPSHNANNDHFITDVSIAISYNPSGALQGPFYQYYNNLLSAILQAGSQNTLSVSGGYLNASSYAVWIDYNRDGDFDDSNEKLSEFTASSPNQLHQIQFSIPWDAQAGATRMRVRCTSAALPLNACSNYPDGESEDYNVTIISSSGSTCLPQTSGGTTAGDFINDVVCSSINNLNTGIAGGQTYHDYSSQVATANVSEILNLQVVSGFRLSDTSGTHYAVWVDWNDNNLFEINEKLGEQIALSGSANEILLFSIPIASDQAAGFYRMRVRAAFDASLNGSNMDSCDDYAFGETEDYRILVVATPAYCTALHAQTCEGSTYINSVRLYNSNLINENSGCNAISGNSYSVWPASGSTITSLVRGTTYYLGVACNTSAKMVAWADWNQNGIFDASEYLEIATTSGPNQYVYNYLNVPSTAQFGTTRLRIRSVPTSFSIGANDACTLYNAGETEDYFLVITNQLGLPPEPDFTFSASGNYIDFSDFSANSPTFWFWQFEQANPGTSISQNVSSVSMQTPGCHAVTLSSSNIYGVGTITKPCAISIGQSTACSELFISEIVDGSAYNKSIELFNPTSNSVNLADYTLELYQNGSEVPSFSQTLSGQIASHGLWVVSNPMSNLLVIQAASNIYSSVTSFDGNDVIALKHRDRIIDLFGAIGEPPTGGWNLGGNSSSAHTFIRKQTSDRSETNWTIASQQWDVFPTDDTQNLGQHNSACGNSIVSQITSNFSASMPEICPGVCISFSDLSSGNPTSWQWSFPGASPNFSNEQVAQQICYSEPGLYPVSLIVSNSNSSDTLTISNYIHVFDSVIPTISFTDNLIICSESASTYLWFLDGALLDGITSQSFQPTQTGEYMVSVPNQQGCYSNSEPFILNILGVSELNSDFTISPNPASNFIHVQSANSFKSGSIEIINAQGKLVNLITLHSSSGSEIPIENLPSGVYFIRMNLDGKCSRKVFVKIPY